ncbi:uncharacterized protein CC84DRAFT_738876 [Paraphaeosphaeria sporulosa]|uniref:Uncharacterized protein n=1 Tax=Paraphaeosphaeria sporulosa TaxID=1460663 RepID=A0A177CF72_9PLEO|nr:uncharacterized protein CC84DRAFT_738876 [Paraphaeosphaeria sporulosa]OAG05851.1 hypothetical protein CC84DRAFT_738876 [Paraphaeosphaeria sporulosa]
MHPGSAHCTSRTLRHVVGVHRRSRCAAASRRRRWFACCAMGESRRRCWRRSRALDGIIAGQISANLPSGDGIMVWHGSGCPLARRRKRDDAKGVGSSDQGPFRRTAGPMIDTSLVARWLPAATVARTPRWPAARRADGRAAAKWRWAAAAARTRTRQACSACTEPSRAASAAESDAWSVCAAAVWGRQKRARAAVNLAGTWRRLAARPPAPALSPRARQNRTLIRQPRCRAMFLRAPPAANGAREIPGRTALSARFSEPSGAACEGLQSRHGPGRGR